MKGFSRISLLAFAALAASAAVLPSDPTSFLLISTSPPTSASADCLKASFLGSYGGSRDQQDHIYFPDEACVTAQSSFDSLDSGRIIPLSSRKDGRILWIGQAGVESEHVDYQELNTVMATWDLISNRAMSLIAARDHAQQVIAQSSTYEALHHTEPLTLLVASPWSYLIHVPDSFLPIIDTFLPPHLVAVALPFMTSTRTSFIPVPSHLAENLGNITANLQFSPQLDRIITEGIKLDDIRRNVRYLTGEAPSGIETRHSFTDGALQASRWIKSKR